MKGNFNYFNNHEGDYTIGYDVNGAGEKLLAIAQEESNAKLISDALNTKAIAEMERTLLVVGAKLAQTLLEASLSTVQSQAVIKGLSDMILSVHDKP